MYINICFPCSLVEGRGKGDSCAIAILIINLFNGFKEIISSFNCLLLLIFFLTEEEEIKKAGH